MIRKIEIQNFKAIKQAQLSFSSDRIDVIIGPNNSGKTTLLQAIAFGTYGRFTRGPALPDSLNAADIFPVGTPSCTITSSYFNHTFGSLHGVTSVRRNPHIVQFEFLYTKHPPDYPDQPVAKVAFALQGSKKLNVTAHASEPEAFYLEVPRAWLCRLVPAQIKAPAPILLDVVGVAEDGFGIPAAFDYLRRNNRNAAEAVLRSFQILYPDCGDINLPIRRGNPEPDYPPPSVLDRQGQRRGRLVRRSSLVDLVVLTRSGLKVPASQLSDGHALALAILTMMHLTDAPSILLLEEPENGFHPTRVCEIAELIKQAVVANPNLQVIMTTHSPLFVGEFEPEQVIVASRDETGDVRFDRVSGSAKLKEALNVLSLGEIWLHEGESRLVKG